MKLAVGVKAFILNDEGKVLILREAKYDEGTNEGKWDVLGGRIQPEETLLAGLKREVMEECGLEIEVGKLLNVQETFPVIKGEEYHIVRIFYQAKLKSVQVVLSSDHDRYEWILPSDTEGKNFVSGMLETLSVLAKGHAGANLNHLIKGTISKNIWDLKTDKIRHQPELNHQKRLLRNIN